MILDSCFIDFLEQEKEAEYTGYLGDYPNLFILKAFTKIYAMAGLRLGYGMSRDERLLERMKNVVQPWSVSIPAQAAGVAALQETAFVHRSAKMIQEERIWLKKQLQNMNLWVCDSQANYLFFEGTEDLSEKCRKEGILIRDCSNYHGLRKGYYRIAVRTRKENEELVQVFRKILKPAEKAELIWQKRLWCRAQCPTQEKVCWQLGFAGYLNRTVIKWHHLSLRIWH